MVELIVPVWISLPGPARATGGEFDGRLGLTATFLGGGQVLQTADRAARPHLRIHCGIDTCVGPAVHLLVGSW